jgi:hypothetical protein
VAPAWIGLDVIGMAIVLDSSEDRATTRIPLWKRGWSINSKIVNTLATVAALKIGRDVKIAMRLSPRDCEAWSLRSVLPGSALDHQKTAIPEAKAYPSNTLARVTRMASRTVGCTE